MTPFLTFTAGLAMGLLLSMAAVLACLDDDDFKR